MAGEWESKPIASVVQKIAKECGEAGCSTWTITKVVKEISKDVGAGEKQLRKNALELLNNFDPAAAKVYASFQRMLVRTSRQTIEHFDRGNIIRSLLKETDVTRGVAEKIGHEVEEKIKDLEISHISTALIRELVNVKLLEYGHEDIRNQYARLGQPIFDIKRKVLHSPYSSSEILSEYNLLRVLPRKLGEMHLHSDIFIASLDCFSTKPIAYCHKFAAKDNLNETIFGNLKKMNRLSRMVAWPINAADVNTALLPFAGKRSIGKAVGLFLNGFESVFYGRTSTPRDIGLNLFLPEGSSESIDRKLIGGITSIFLRQGRNLAKNNNRIVLVIDTKYKLKLLGQGSLDGTTLLNCKDRKLLPLNGIAAEQNLCGLFGLNVVKAASGSRERTFFEAMEGQLKAASELAGLKKNILSKRDYLKRAGFDVKNMGDAAGLYGVFQAAALVTQSNDGKEIKRFAEKIVSNISKGLGKQFVVTELLNKAGIARFEAGNRKAGIPPRMALPEGAGPLGTLQMSVRAGNKKEAADWIDKDATLIRI